MGYSVDELVDLYVELALKFEAGTGMQGDGRVIKWNPDSVVKVVAQPVGTFISQNALADTLVDETKRVTDAIASRAPDQQIVAFDRTELLRFVETARVIGPSALANSILVLLADRGELVKRIDTLSEQSPDAVSLKILLSQIPSINEPICAGWTLKEARRDTFVFRGFVFIEYSPGVTGCLFEELMQSFGIYNDFPDGTASIFNDDNVYQEPTELDWLLWKVHLDPRIKSGMTEVEVRPIAHNIISEIILK